MKNSEKTMEKIVALCKGRGFVYSGSEIYGGLANTWDYGPLGVEFKNNVKAAWRKKFVQESPYNVGLDSAILMNPMTWVASGHVGGFSDPLMDCKECKERFRADKLIEDWCAENNYDLGKSVDALSQAEMKAFIDEHEHRMPDLRQAQLDRHPSVQPDVQDLPGRYREREERAVSASGDRTGHLRKLPEYPAHHP